MKTQTIKRGLLVAAAAAFVWLAWKAPAQDAATAAYPPQMADSVQQVLKLEQAKVGDSTVIAYINNSPSSYGLNAEQIIYLRNRGVSDAVLTAMLTQSRAGVAPNASQTAPAYPPPAAQSAPIADTAVIAPATPPPTVTYVQTVPTTYYSYDYPGYAYYGWPFGWVWWGGFWHWGGGWNGGWHGGYSHGGWNTGWHGGGAWHGGGSSGGWHGGGGGGGWHGGGHR